MVVVFAYKKLFMRFFIGNRQLFTAAFATRSYHAPSIRCGHAIAKTVFILPFTF